MGLNGDYRGDPSTLNNRSTLLLGKVRDFMLYHFATGFGTGHSPIASGTVGSALAVVFVLAFWPESYLWQLALAVATTLLAVWASGWVAESEGLKDPSIVVADEIAGQFFTFLFLPVAVMGWQALLAGFLLFRIFDIWKPWPVSRLEDLPGGWGIVLDDVLAGIFANIVLRVLLIWM